MFRTVISMLAVASVLAGCRETTAPRDSRPAAPRGLYSVTGDHEAFLHWLPNTERDVVAYRIYESPCATGPECPYDRIGTVDGTSFVVSGLANGETRFFAVAAVDRSGNESDLTYEDVFDTPRPEGFGLSLTEYHAAPRTSGYDFSQFVVLSFDHDQTDIYFGFDGTTRRMFTLFTDTEIQDAGYTSSLDDVDFAPTTGWASSGNVELVLGHSYVVWTHQDQEDHYAKFRVTRLNDSQVTFDWAYQVAEGNRELKAQPTDPRKRVRRSPS